MFTHEFFYYGFLPYLTELERINVLRVSKYSLLYTQKLQPSPLAHPSTFEITQYQKCLTEYTLPILKKYFSYWSHHVHDHKPIFKLFVENCTCSTKHEETPTCTCACKSCITCQIKQSMYNNSKCLITLKPSYSYARGYCQTSVESPSFGHHLSVLLPRYGDLMVPPTIFNIICEPDNYQSYGEPPPKLHLQKFTTTQKLIAIEA